MGVAGEPWFQAPGKIEAKYEAAGEESRKFAFDRASQGYRIYKLRATSRNWVARVEGPGIAGFAIRPGYDPSRPLRSPAGGYVVMDEVADPYNARPGDVWLVQGPLFDSTYELIPGGEPEGDAGDLGPAPGRDPRPR